MLSYIIIIHIFIYSTIARRLQRRCSIRFNKSTSSPSSSAIFCLHMNIHNGKTRSGASNRNAQQRTAERSVQLYVWTGLYLAWKPAIAYQLLYFLCVYTGWRITVELIVIFIIWAPAAQKPTRQMYGAVWMEIL